MHKITSAEDLLAVPDLLAYQGKKYRLAELTIEHRCQFSRWLEARARADAGRAILEMPEEAAEKYAAGVRRDIHAGVYSWGSAVSAVAVINPDGAAYMLMLRLKDEHPEVDEEFAAKMYDGLLAEKVSALHKALESEDPKVRAAAEALLRAFGLKLGSSAARS